MTILEDLESSQTELIILPSNRYLPLVLDFAKQLSGRKVGYVTLNKTCRSLAEDFKKKKIDTSHFIFLDAVSPLINPVVANEQEIYVENPEELTHLSMGIKVLLEKKCEIIIFDSITSLSIYHEVGKVVKFVSNTLAKIKTTQSKAIFYVLMIPEDGKLIAESGMSFDSVIDAQMI